MTPINSIKVNIGIPAYNEGINVNKLVLQLLEQIEDGFIIDKIIVISDGSADNTVSEVEKISDSRILLINHTDRKGKAARFQELLKLSDSEVLIQLDADIKLENNFVIREMVKSVQNGADLVFSKISPLKPRTYIEKLAFYGMFTWERVLAQMPEDAIILHRCQGRCRAFSKHFYKNFNLPIKADSIEDIYSFCFAIINGFKPMYAPNALIRFRLPATVNDFIKQTRRFVKGADNLFQFYGKDLVEKYMPTTRMKIIALIKTIFRFPPYISLGYILLQFYSRKTATMENQKPMYEYVGSTKKL